MDLIPLWPKAILPTILAQNHAWYLNTFNDQLIIKFEPWFASFFAIEAFYQLPMTLWFLFALPKGMYIFHRLIRILPDLVIVADNPKLTVHMLVYGAVGLVTTTTCCAAIYTEKDMSQMEKNVVLGFYSPFAVICMCPPHIFRFQHRLLIASPSCYSRVYNDGYDLSDTVQNLPRHRKKQEEGLVER